MKEKDKYFQQIRGICIICVIIIHCLTYNDNLMITNFNILTRIIINFAVAVFIFLSGYFTKSEKIKNTKSFFQNRFKKLYIPFITWSLIYTIIARICGGGELIKDNFKVIIRI